MDSESTRRTFVTLIHESGMRIKVNLTDYELAKAAEDKQFKAALIDKYYQLYQKGFICSSKDASPSAAPTILQEEYPSNYKMMEDNVQEQEEAVEEVQKDFISTEDVELLITLVSQRPPLFDMRMPLKQRGRETITQLWNEVVTELNLNITVADVSSRWKNIRDSYLRTRSNINKKIASGSSAAEKLKAEVIRKKRKHYDQLEFLNDTLEARTTASNISTPMCSRREPSDTDSREPICRPKRQLQSAITAATATQPLHSLTATQHFCLRLAASLEQLPRAKRTKLEIQFLQQIAEAENECSDD